MPTNNPPIAGDERVIIFGTVTADENTHTVFRPWMSKKHNVLGWAAKPHRIVEQSYIYIAPTTDSKPGAEPSFYLYIGPHGDPEKDRCLGPFTLDVGS